MNTPGVGQGIRVQGDQPIDPQRVIYTQPTGPSIASRIAALAKAGMSLTDKTNPTRRTVTQTSPEIQSAKGQLSSAVAGCDRTAQQSGISPEAKAVYQRLSNILQIAKKKIGDDFSADNIATALSSALKARTDLSTAGGTGTVGMYHGNIDGSEYRELDGKNVTVRTRQGYAAPDAWGEWIEDPNGQWIRPRIAEGQEKCIEKCKRAHVPSHTLGASVSHPQNPKPKALKEGDPKYDFSKLTADEPAVTGKVYTRELGDGKLTWPSEFPLSEYSSQLEREFNTFSGEVKIHKLEPGTVLVRVFGKGQTVKGACWCRADDATSSVTCAGDLYKKLAVMAEWNGDGNLGVFVVPEGVDIYVAEGKIASQMETYKGEQEDANGNVSKREFSFVYPGGGTQVNILTPNPIDEHLFPHFAGVSPDIFEKCMFCFRNDGIMKPEDQEPNTQN